jgi:hypothetical protein
MRAPAFRRTVRRLILLSVLGYVGFVYPQGRAEAQDPPGPNCGETMVFYFDAAKSEYAGHISRDPYNPQVGCYCQRYQAGTTTPYHDTMDNSGYCPES